MGKYDLPVMTKSGDLLQDSTKTKNKQTTKQCVLGTNIRKQTQTT
jgi:hypothetical protein